MRITKPDDVLFLQAFEKRSDQCFLIATIGYVVEADGRLMPEKEAWQWLAPLFPDEPFDIGQQKKRGTFAVSGSAYAPNGSTVTRMAIRVRFGSREKTLHVHGDRHWQSGLATLRASDPTPFARMPIDLAHAMGCVNDATNPYGKGLPTEGKDFTGVCLPNIEWPDSPILSTHDRPPPATLGNRAASDPSLIPWAGTFDLRWETTRFPWLPDDVDPRYFDRVAQDQCVDTYWRGDERWSVEGMHPDEAMLSGSLPGLQPSLLWLRGDASPWATPASPIAQSATLRLDTVWLFPDSKRQVLLYRAAIPVQREDAADLEAIWINTWPAGTSVPSPNAQFSMWAEQAPELAPRLAATAAGAAATTAASAATHVSEGNAVNVMPSPEHQAVPSSAMASSDDTLAEHLTPSTTAATATTATADSSTAWGDALWDDICKQYGDAWESGRNVVRKMQEEQADYGVVFPDVEPFVPPPRPLPSPVGTGVPDNLIQHITDQIDAGLEKGQRLFEEVVKDNYPNDPKAVEAILEHVRNASQIPISNEQINNVLSNLPPELRERGDTEIKALFEEFNGLNERIIDTFHTKTTASELPSDAPPIMSSHDGLVTSPSPEAVPKHVPLPDDEGHALSERNFSGATLEKQSYAGENLAQANFAGANIVGCDFSNTDLSGASFKGSHIDACDFTGATLDHAHLHDMDARDTRFNHATWRHAQAQRMSLSQCDLSNIDATSADLSSTQLDQCTLNEACFQQAQLIDTTFSGVHAVSADFSDTQARGLRIDSQTTLENSSFERADLQTCSFQKSFFPNNAWHDTDVTDGLIVACDLSGMHAQRLLARRTVFKDSLIRDVNWQHANLMEAAFDYAILERLDAAGANLHGVQTRTAMVRSIQLNKALLSHTRLVQEHAHD